MSKCYDQDIRYKNDEYDKRDKNCCEMIKGNNFDIDIEENDCEIKSDIIVAHVEYVRLWGQVRDCKGRPVENAMIKLIKVIHEAGGHIFRGIAHTITDCQGFYQFDVPSDEKNGRYKVIVGKAAKGRERVIKTMGNCQPCQPDPCDSK